MLVTLHSEDQTDQFGAAFARRLVPGDVVALSGPLGSGKTTIVRAIVRALHGRDATSSPTFTFRHRYDGTPPVDHIDLFRIDDPHEITELGLDEAFAGESIVLVEWWRNAPELIPPRRYEIDVEGVGDLPRTLTLREPR
ncbi:MAG TPA: tRNA (adenosine(37)-N6)-threonylcarbamoyltransferase complex ATPase subunit type 1 TsaE [Candidatus Cybelea sp.]|nr:tRNA (adenosine(37)-N6)-threonylcarbamoyltransferase complex ATPase subunit type 1 TsaE [Candidatus Cybelea sp.]